MTEVYWIAGASLQYSGETFAPGSEQMIEHPLISALLKKGAARMAWVDQVHWISGDSKSLSGAESAGILKISEQKPLLAWSEQAGSPHYVLHAASRSIMVGDCDLAVIAQSGQSDGSAVLLASPKAVGRYNLLPRARIIGRWELGGAGQNLNGPDDQILEKITKNKRHPSEIQLISLQLRPGVVQDAFSKLFPEAHILEVDLFGSSKVLSRLNHLIDQLEKRSVNNGLLISWPADELVVVSWVERV